MLKRPNSRPPTTAAKVIRLATTAKASSRRRGDVLSDRFGTIGEHCTEVRRIHLRRSPHDHVLEPSGVGYAEFRVLRHWRNKRSRWPRRGPGRRPLALSCAGYWYECSNRNLLIVRLFGRTVADAVIVDRCAWVRRRGLVRPSQTTMNEFETCHHASCSTWRRIAVVPVAEVSAPLGGAMGGGAPARASSRDADNSMIGCEGFLSDSLPTWFQVHKTAW